MKFPTILARGLPPPGHTLLRQLLHRVTPCYKSIAFHERHGSRVDIIPFWNLPTQLSIYLHPPEFQHAYEKCLFSIHICSQISLLHPSEFQHAYGKCLFFIYIYAPKSHYFIHLSFNMPMGNACFSSIYMLPNLTTSSIQVPTCLWEMLVFHPYMLPNLSSRLVGSRKFLHYRKAKASTKMLPNRI